MSRKPNRTDYSGGFPANFDTFQRIFQATDPTVFATHLGKLHFTMQADKSPLTTRHCIAVVMKKPPTFMP